MSTFGTRFRKQLVDPTVLTLPVVAPVFWAARRLDLIAATPIWLLCALLAGFFLLSCVTTALWGRSHDGWRLWARIGEQAFGITAVMYAIGWGPMLAIGLIFGAVEGIRLSGSRAVVPAMVTSVAALALGELAIAAGIAPTLVEQPLVHGLAVLAALGLTFSIKLFERATVDTEHVQAELRQSEQRFRALVQHASDIIMVLDSGSGIRYVSPAFATILGYAADEVLGVSGLELAHPADVEMLRATIIGTPNPTTGTAEVRLCHRDGTWRWFDVIVTDLSKDPSVDGWVANLRDITERKASEAALNEAQEAFRHAFDDAPIGIGLVALDGTIQRANRAMAVLLGRTQEELVGVTILDVTHPDDRATSDEHRERLARNEIDFYRLEKRYLRPDGTTVWASLSVSLVRDLAGEPLYQIGQLEDITDRKNLSDRLAHDAAHDSMTGLLNRASFTDCVAAALAADDDRKVAVLFIDLDHFKVVNDSLGHAVGDELVTSIASRLRSSLRPGNVIARFGGDEFVVLCDDLADDEAASNIARRLLDAVAEPVSLSAQEVFVTASIGIAVARRGDDSETLLRHADAAMYRAKNDGRARAIVFLPDEHGSAVAALRTGTDLHRALERDELVLHYQPIVDLRTGRVVGFEALVRWNHPERGLIPPADFIGLAEETGLIVPIGAWVLETACRQIVHWQSVRDRETGGGRLTMNVNLSPRQLADPSLTKTVARILRDTGANPDAVCLELTENALMQNADATTAELHALRALGVHLSIDDFGTGYSSLSYLKRFPVEALKIDRSFIDGLGTDHEDTSIVEAIVTLAHALGLTAVAEGLETPTQLDALRKIGCDFAQGYLLGRATAAEIIGDVPADDLTSWHAST
jgi:diguanylate cyclase (GGDEF)-like protein/PAS domain S-box-containing protein